MYDLTSLENTVVNLNDDAKNEQKMSLSSKNIYLLAMINT